MMISLILLLSQSSLFLHHMDLAIVIYGRGSQMRDFTLKLRAIVKWLISYSTIIKFQKKLNYILLYLCSETHPKHNRIVSKKIVLQQNDEGVPLKTFNSKRKSHLIKKDLWKNVKPVIIKYANAVSYTHLTLPTIA